MGVDKYIIGVSCLKILVLSLLRLGDIFIALPAIRRLKSKYPSAEIHLMVNRQNSEKIRSFNIADKIINFDRDYLQKAMTSIDHPIFEPLLITNQFIQQLNLENYNVVVNLTQTKLSGYLTAAIRAEEKLGLSINRSQVQFGSPWLKYLNNLVEIGAEDIFHYSDIFKFAINATNDVYHDKFLLNETSHGREELNEFYAKHKYSTGYNIVIQAFTSDSKKNWSSRNWAQLIKNIKIAHPVANIILLGSPLEKNDLEKISLSLDKGIQVKIAILGFDGALSLLHQADLLISSDTSIKHLAAFTKVQIVELALGSSDFRKTGSYKDGSVIVSSKASCAPCKHTESCHQSSHRCAEDISVNGLSLIIKSIIDKNANDFKIVASEYSDEFDVRVASISSFGFWQAHQVCESKRTDEFDQQIQKLAWYLLLENEHKNQIGIYGSLIEKHKKVFVDFFNDDTAAARESSLMKHEQEFEKLETKIDSIINQVTNKFKLIAGRDFNFNKETQLINEIKYIEKSLGLGSYLSEKINNQYVNSFAQARALQNSLNDTYHLQKIKIKLLKQIRQQLKV